MTPDNPIVPPYQPDVRDLDDVTILRECMRRFGMKPAELERIVTDKIAAILVARGQHDSG